MCKHFAGLVPDGFTDCPTCTINVECQNAYEHPTVLDPAIDLGWIKTGSEWDGWALSDILACLIGRGSAAHAAADMVKAIRANRAWVLAQRHDSKTLPAATPDAPTHPLTAREHRRALLARDGAHRDGSDEYYAANGDDEWQPSALAVTITNDIMRR